MKRITLLLMCTVLGPTSRATPPMSPRPVDTELQEFRQFTLPSFRRLTKEIQTRLLPSTTPRRAELVNGMNDCIEVLEKEAAPRFEQALKSKENLSELLVSVEVLLADLSDLRMCVDELLLESALEKTLRSDAAFMEDVRQFWLNERLYRLRFGMVPLELFTAEAKKKSRDEKSGVSPSSTQATRQPIKP